MIQKEEPKEEPKKYLEEHLVIGQPEVYYSIEDAELAMLGDGTDSYDSSKEPGDGFDSYYDPSRDY